MGVLATFDGTMKITLYCPYWMVNKTGLYLEYKVGEHPQYAGILWVKGGTLIAPK